MSKRKGNPKRQSAGVATGPPSTKMAEYPYKLPLPIEDFALLQWAKSFTTTMPPYETGIVYTTCDKHGPPGFVEGATIAGDGRAWVAWHKP